MYLFPLIYNCIYFFSCIELLIQFSVVFALFMFKKGLLCSFYNVYQMRMRQLLKVYHMEDTMTIFSNIWIEISLLV